MILDDWLEFAKAVIEAAEAAQKSVEAFACFYKEASDRIVHKRDCQSGWIRQTKLQAPRSIIYRDKQRRPYVRSTICTHKNRRR